MGKAKKKKNVLVVESDLAARESLRFLLKDEYNVFVAENGFKALEILQSTRIDTITLDLNIPGIHGRAILNKIKKTKPDVEIILVSGYSLSPRPPPIMIPSTSFIAVSPTGR